MRLFRGYEIFCAHEIVGFNSCSKENNSWARFRGHEIQMECPGAKETVEVPLNFIKIMFVSSRYLVTMVTL